LFEAIPWGREERIRNSSFIVLDLPCYWGEKVQSIGKGDAQRQARIEFIL
jgi:hypothetical protein